jgi:hypothetical protein
VGLLEIETLRRGYGSFLFTLLIFSLRALACIANHVVSNLVGDKSGVNLINWVFYLFVSFFLLSFFINKKLYFHEIFSPKFFITYVVFFTIVCCILNFLKNQNNKNRSKPDQTNFANFFLKKMIIFADFINLVPHASIQVQPSNLVCVRALGLFYIITVNYHLNTINWV